MSEAGMKARAVALGYSIKVFKTTAGNCYEIYGQDKAGKSVDQAVKEYSVPGRFKGYVANVNPQFGGPKPNLEIAYKELGRR